MVRRHLTEIFFILQGRSGVIRGKQSRRVYFVSRLKHGGRRKTDRHRKCGCRNVRASVSPADVICRREVRTLSCIWESGYGGVVLYARPVIASFTRSVFLVGDAGGR